MKKGRILAIDYGRARLGIAVSDPMQMISRALTTVEGKGKPEKSAPQLLPLLKEHAPVQIVVGLPIHMSGESSEMSAEVEKFIAALKELTDVPIATLDERLTSMQADRYMREGNLNRKERAKKIDALSAQILLQTYLEMQS